MLVLILSLLNLMWVLLVEIFFNNDIVFIKKIFKEVKKLGKKVGKKMNKEVERDFWDIDILVEDLGGGESSVYYIVGVLGDKVEGGGGNGDGWSWDDDFMFMFL